MYSSLEYVYIPRVDGQLDEFSPAAAVAVKAATLNSTDAESCARDIIKKLEDM